ncbi:MAG TPA: MupA/Atu3671 family FMN-dependent luciferase-like monooxygenase [Methylomirabilota bacterium]|nr:MupA/Atu3671 family FMN-dependent luciferase-like monooxygenase [Methylomirabilota bacterium]
MPDGEPGGRATFSTVIVGEGPLLIPCAEILLRHGHTIRAILAANQVIQEWAREQKIRSLSHQDEILAVGEGRPFDYLFSIANLAVIPGRILALPRLGAINFHDGPLPRYAGLHATTWAILNRETSHGVTWHEMRETVDTGDILQQRVFALAPDDTAYTLNRKCFNAGIDSFEELVQSLGNGGLRGVPQKGSERTYFAKHARPAAQACIDWTLPAETIAAAVRSLDFGPYPNPLEVPKVIGGGNVWLAPRLELLSALSESPPGTVLEVDGQSVRVATSTNQVVIPQLLTFAGETVDIAAAGIAAGFRFGTLPPETAARLSQVGQQVVRHEEFWLERLLRLAPLRPSSEGRRARMQSEESRATVALVTPLVSAVAGNGAAALSAALILYLARTADQPSFDIGFGHGALEEALAGLEQFFAPQVPLHVGLDGDGGVNAALGAVLDELASVKVRQTYARSLPARTPELRGRDVRLPVGIVQRDGPEDAVENDLTIAVSSDGRTSHWTYRTSVFDPAQILERQRAFTAFLRRLTVGPDAPLAAISLLDDAERERLLVAWNATRKAHSDDVCVHELFERQVRRTPDAVALVCEDEQRSYDELNRSANQLARHLRTLGAGPDVLVGLCLERSIDLVTGVYGILKAGAAYVPLDPAYPTDRLALMLDDSECPILLTQQSLLQRLPPHHAHVVCIDGDWDRIERESGDDLDSGVICTNLAYVIYTSGSTGRPKGVMVEHRNVTNFFAGMDDCIPHGPPGTWLAVTSLSFDISVLELFWTTVSGFKVVLYRGSDRGARAAGLEFSLFYFASDEGENAADKYALLLEGAKFADRHGFAAVWTPERHFGAFGGLYPNPSVTSAALASITNSIGIRAGSCVSPLHNPIRIAEEWAVVDNISGGRVGISFASGWQPDDFVLQPLLYANRKETMFHGIETVRRLWRGETVRFPGPNGKEVEVRTLPRPVQAELPVWVTVAGNPETFRMAGAGGFRVLTHLLGQSVERLVEKLSIYRKAWREHGHPGDGYVTLMLHTFVGDADDQVREVVRQPMIDYLASALDLTEQAAWSFPTFKERASATGQTLSEMFAAQSLTPEEKSAILGHAFERYFETSGLFGTVDTCLAMVRRLKDIGIDELACLIDFGVASSTALQHLEHLNRLRELAGDVPARAAGQSTIPALIARHKVTHLQCTPSMASLLTADRESRLALRGLTAMMVGGEALPAALAQDLGELVLGKLFNMYGPTETTIWSSTYTIAGDETTIPIGRPIANTVLYILDQRMQPVPVGTPGDLYIGGKGVARGYWKRPDLTADRFVSDPFDGPDGRLYRTGDVAAYRADGNVEFLGRSDDQVKLRGHRIELGEIEALLEAFPGVAKSVVLAREDTPGDKRLVAYVKPTGPSGVSAKGLREHLRAKLPEFMVPTHFVEMREFPLTPNLKINRKALPAPGATPAPPVEGRSDAPSGRAGALERQLVSIWQEVLGLPQIDVHDDFFDLGGHSLLIVQLHRRISALVHRPVAVADLFRHSTVHKLAAFLLAAGGLGIE